MQWSHWTQAVPAAPLAKSVVAAPGLRAAGICNPVELSQSRPAGVSRGLQLLGNHRRDHQGNSSFLLLSLFALAGSVQSRGKSAFLQASSSARQCAFGEINPGIRSTGGTQLRSELLQKSLPRCKNGDLPQPRPSPAVSLAGAGCSLSWTDTIQSGLGLFDHVQQCP